MEEKDSFFLQSLARLSRALFCQVDSQDILDGALFFVFISFVSILPGFTFPFLLHTTQCSCFS